MNKENLISDEELSKISGGVELPELPDRDMLRGGKVYVRTVDDNGNASEWVRLTEENCNELTVKEAGKYKLEYIVWGG